MEKKVIAGLFILIAIGHNLSFGQLSSGPISGITQEFGKDVNTEILEEYGSAIGTITYLRRASRKVKAKFFAYKVHKTGGFNKYNRFGNSIYLSETFQDSAIESAIKNALKEAIAYVDSLKKDEDIFE